MATSEGIPSSIDIEFLELNDNPYISYICMMVGQQTLRPTVVSVYNYMQPLVSVSVSVAVGLAVFKTSQALAAILVFSGVWFVVKSKSKHDMSKA